MATSSTIWQTARGTIAREGSNTWPNSTIFFRLGQHAPAKTSRAPDPNPYKTRAVRGPGLPLTWIAGRYDVPSYNEYGKPTLCKYPNTIRVDGGKRRCIPVKDAAERAAAMKAEAARQEAIKKAVSKRLSAQIGTSATDKSAVCKKQSWYMKKTTDKYGRPVYTKTDCRTGRSLEASRTIVVKGLDGLSGEEGAPTKESLEADYRKTEFLLIACLAAAGLAVMR